MILQVKPRPSLRFFRFPSFREKVDIHNNHPAAWSSGGRSASRPHHSPGLLFEGSNSSLEEGFFHPREVFHSSFTPDKWCNRKTLLSDYWVAVTFRCRMGPWIILPNSFGGAFGGFGNAHEGGALVFALSLAGSDFGGKGGGSGLGIALGSIFFFLIFSATSSTISMMTSFWTCLVFCTWTSLGEERLDITFLTFDARPMSHETLPSSKSSQKSRELNQPLEQEHILGQVELSYEYYFGEWFVPVGVWVILICALLTYEHWLIGVEDQPSCCASVKQTVNDHPLLRQSPWFHGCSLLPHANDVRWQLVSTEHHHC